MEKALKKWWPLFILPTMAAFTIGFLIPFVWGLYLSFCEFTTVNDAVWVGLNNYVLAFTDPSSYFNHSLWYTALFAVVSTVIINVLGLTVAILLVRGIRGTNIFRTVFFMPNLIGGIVLGWLWQVLINGVLAKYGVTIVTNEWYGFWSLILVMTWQQLGYMMIIYISGLQSIPEELMEAASIDGANAWQTLRFVKLPMLMPSITICTFLTITNGFKLFDQNLALTGGAPSVIENMTKVNKTELLALNIYSTYNINKNWHGVAQAKAVIFFILVAVLAIAQQAATSSKEVQQ